jgi:hypothetical protein
MVAGKLFTEPIHPGEGVFSTLLLGRGIWPGPDESWADSAVSRITGSPRKMRAFKVPPESLQNL